MTLDNLHPHANEWSCTLTLYHMQNVTQIKNLNIKAKTIKLLEDIGKIFMMLDLAMISWVAWEEQAAKEKIEKLDFTKILNFCVTKKKILSEKTTHRMRENFANHISDRILISSWYRYSNYFQIHNSSCYSKYNIKIYNI